MNQTAEDLSARIQELPSSQLAQVERLVSLLESERREATLRNAAASISEPTFSAIWSNPEDEVYDEL